MIGHGLLLILAVYFLPSIVAHARGHLSAGAITLLNLLLGWTAIGWIVALIWSFTGNTRANLEASQVGAMAELLRRRDDRR